MRRRTSAGPSMPRPEHSRASRPPRVVVVAANPADIPLRVVAVTYSPGDVLEGFIESLAGATTRPVEIVLADNGSTDGSPEAAAAKHPHVTLLPTGGNIGYGAAPHARPARLTSRYAGIAHPHVPVQPGSGGEPLPVAPPG